MPDGMPYYVEKGQYFSLLDSLAKQSPEVLLAIRNDLDSGTSLATIAGGLTPPEFQQNFGKHLGDDWFGDADPPTKSTTGWWMSYKGNVEAVMRETFIRAIDVSFGITRSTSPAKFSDATRHWPIQFLWICGSRWFEGWVNWHSWGTGAKPTHEGDHALTEGGVVTVMFVTPGMKGKEMYRQPQRPGYVGKPDYEDNPDAAMGDHGLWCVSDSSHDPDLTGFGFGWKIDGHMAIPTTFSSTEYVDGGQVVTVGPAEADGGVLHAGRTY